MSKKGTTSISDFAGKRVLVMGLGLHGGGIGTVKFLIRRGARVTCTDLRSVEDLQPSLLALSKYKNIRYVLGRHREKDFLNTDIIFKNQSVRPHSPFLALARKRHIPVTTDTAVFFRECPARIIGITGTRGKSTTTALIAAFLKKKYKRVFLAGNIRKSMLDILPQLKKGDWVVLELSSFQLDDLTSERLSPHIAVFTNFYRDHLNWHKNMTDYLRAKSNIFRFQKRGDTLYIPKGDSLLLRTAKSARSRVVQTVLPREFRHRVEEKLGAHYRPSVGLAVAVARKLGVPLSDIRSALLRFHGLEARQEEIAVNPASVARSGVKRGVHYINDTTATTPEAAIAAIARFRPRARRLILIAGGQDKVLDFREMARAISRFVDTLILLPGTGTEKLMTSSKKQAVSSKHAMFKIVHVQSMKEAVRIAARNAKKGDYVVLSPGATSFSTFLNEFDRGNAFVAAVRALR